MRVELRGTIRAALGSAELEIAVSPDGVPLSELLHALARDNPRARPYLSDRRGQATLRVVHNGAALTFGDDPLVREGDKLLLLHAVAGG